MGVSDKMNHFIGSVQTGAKKSSLSLVLLALRIVTAFVLALTISMIAQELFNFGNFAFVFVMLTTAGLCLKLTAKWSIGGVLIFDLICILVALLLRMYILVAP